MGGCHEKAKMGQVVEVGAGASEGCDSPGRLPDGRRQGANEDGVHRSVGAGGRVQGRGASGVRSIRPSVTGVRVVGLEDCRCVIICPCK